VAHVIDKSGSHFDPNVVRCFQEHLPEILAIGNEHREPHV